MPATDDSASEHSENQRNSAHRTMGMSIRPMTGTWMFDAIAELTKNPSAEREQNEPEEPELVEEERPTLRRRPHPRYPRRHPLQPPVLPRLVHRHQIPAPPLRHGAYQRHPAVKPPTVASTGPGAKPSAEAPANPPSASLSKSPRPSRASPSNPNRKSPLTLSASSAASTPPSLTSSSLHRHAHMPRLRHHDAHILLRPLLPLLRSHWIGGAVL
ncbi:hypothetical protein M422DRAFT_271478 [Sphaerobolus stellatus SS14]|uniref:Uncharacterized protein n=1 Tax=Sphaerobolus stellatus (strain SS14) TaxID=990650 RepID=A0A0C9TZZ0_SPHS4|nr:hypothetical protein M422DRAFT_271478 [Sphaerobolus stellatus SS14]